MAEVLLIDLNVSLLLLVCHLSYQVIVNLINWYRFASTKDRRNVIVIIFGIHQCDIGYNWKSII